jgi:hypothetical protein
MSNRSTISPQRIAAKDRRVSAIHEAGHVTMARHIGLQCVSASLQKVSGQVDLIEQKLWVGQTRYLRPEALGKKLSYRKRAMFAVAGAVAECCWRRESFDEAYEGWYDEDSMSDSDWAGCNCEPGNPTRRLFQTIEEVFSLFDRGTGKLWPVVLKEARWLIVEGRVSAPAAHSSRTAPAHPAAIWSKP